jgi:hypothetical protein
MPEADYQINRPVHEAKRRRYKRQSFVLVIIFVLVVVGLAIVAYKLFYFPQVSDKSKVGANYEQQIAGPRTFKSSYFQFSDNEDWVYAPNDSTPTKLTYLLYEDGVPAHSVTVYVNQTPLQTDLAVTRALPVQILNGSSFNVGSISAPCSSTYTASDKKVIKPVSISGTTILCVPDSPQYSVIVGQIGSDYDLSLKRSDGEIANYIIIYTNLSVNPDPSPFLTIMKSFKAL